MWSHRIGEEREAQDHEKCRAVEHKKNKRFTDTWPIQHALELRRRRNEMSLSKRSLTGYGQKRSHGKSQIARRYKGKTSHKVKSIKYSNIFTELYYVPNTPKHLTYV